MIQMTAAESYVQAVRVLPPRLREEALSLPGVAAVFTAEDIPGQNKVGHLVKDWDTMIAVGGMTHYLGDAICLVVAESPEILEKAKRMVQVEYEVLTPVRSPQEAMAHDAPLVHPSGNLLAHKHIQQGNAALAIARSKHVLTRRVHETGRFYDADLEELRQSYDGLWDAAQKILVSLARLQ